jgi:hypothetical protein
MLVTVKKIQGSKKKPFQSAKWLCKCDCGNTKITLETSLYKQYVKSCGCRDFRNKKIHGESNYIDLCKKKIINSIKTDANNCWIWQKSKHRQGYGNLGIGKKHILAHRLSWEVFKGPIPSGIKVCHHCDIPSCVNPDHLFLGTQKENVKDAIEKGKFKDRRSALGEKAGSSKLKEFQVAQIRKQYAEGTSRKELEKKFKVGSTCIQKIITGKTWKIKHPKEQ